jgi:hypothetical protein
MKIRDQEFILQEVVLPTQVGEDLCSTGINGVARPSTKYPIAMLLAMFFPIHCQRVANSFRSHNKPHSTPRRRSIVVDAVLHDRSDV